MDMVVALITALLGDEVAAKVELAPRRDPTWRPFAALNGLAP